MPKSHSVIGTPNYQGPEPFTLGRTPIPQTLMDFWRWMGSNLLNNTMRGRLAEYIVASALGITEQKPDAWSSYDLKYQGLKIEIKSASYFQVWFQKDYSKISFNITPRLAWDPETGIYNGPAKRQSDLYVLCILETKDIEKLDPLDLDQWIFYLVPTKVLDEQFPNQNTLSETGLKRLGLDPVRYSQLNNKITEIAKSK